MHLFFVECGNGNDGAAQVWRLPVRVLPCQSKAVAVLTTHGVVAAKRSHGVGSTEAVTAAVVAVQAAWRAHHARHLLHVRGATSVLQSVGGVHVCFPV